MRKRIFPQYFVEIPLRIIPDSEPFDYPAYLCRFYDSRVYLAYLDDTGSWWPFQFGSDRITDCSGDFLEFIKRHFP